MATLKASSSDLFGREKMKEGKEHLTDVSHISREKEQVEFTNQPRFFQNMLWELTAAGVADEMRRQEGLPLIQI